MHLKMSSTSPSQNMHYGNSLEIDYSANDTIGPFTLWVLRDQFACGSCIIISHLSSQTTTLLFPKAIWASSHLKKLFSTPPPPPPPPRVLGAMFFPILQLMEGRIMSPNTNLEQIAGSMVYRQWTSKWNGYKISRNGHNILAFTWL